MAAAVILLEEEDIAGGIPEVMPLVEEIAGASLSLLAGPTSVATAFRRLPRAIRMGGSSGVPRRSENSSG